MQEHIEVATPFGPVKSLIITHPRTVWELYYEMDVPENRPVVCVLNGKPLLRKYWNTLISPEDTVSFTLIPQGKWLSQILAVVAAAVLAVVAPWLGGILAPILGISAQLATAGVFLVGSLLINALMPSPSKSNNVENNSASPTYSLNAQGNTARLYNPIPRMYGRHLLFPDFASMPWANYESNEQYLYQLLCLGLGEYEVLEVRIEDTVIWTSTGGYTGNLQGGDLEVIPPYGTVTLFPAEVQSADEVSGQQLRSPYTSGTVSFSGAVITSGTTNAFDKFVTGDVIRITTGSNIGTATILGINGNQTQLTCDRTFVTTSYSTVIEMDMDHRWIGPFVINSASTAVNKLQYDIALSSGLYYLNDNGSLSSNSTTIEMQARKIDSAGLPISDWVTLSTETITRSTMTSQRITYEFEVDLARYEGRCRRTTAEVQSTKHQTATYWASARGFVPDDNVYPDVTLLAIKIRASGQLTSDSSHKINVLQQAKIPVWNGATWVTQSSRSIAWAAVDALHNPVYGGKLPYSQIDLDTFLALDTLWDSREDYFDGVFDSKDTLLACLYTILRAGRAQPLFAGGIVSAYRDQERTLTKAVFTPRNIVRNTLQVTHILYDDESADDVIVEFMDNRTWQTNEVQCTAEDSTSAVPSRTEFKGITGRAHSFREGSYEAAVNSKRRIMCSFDTELEGRILLRGDRIIVAHDFMKWGHTGEILLAELIAGVWYLQVSEPLPESTIGDCYVLLRTRTGKPFGAVLCTIYTPYVLRLDPDDLADIQADQSMLLADVIVPDDGSAELTPYVFGTATTTYKNWLVIAGTPRQGSKVNLVCVNDDPDVYLADLQTPPDEVYPYGPGTLANAPQVEFLNAISGVETTADLVQLIVSWEDYSYALSYVLYYSYDNESWSIGYQGASTGATIYVLPGVIYLRCAGIRTVRGDFTYFTGTFGTVSIVPAAPVFTTLAYSIEAGVLNIAWTASARSTSYLCEIYSESVVDSGNYNTLELSYATSATAVTVTASEITSAGGPWKNILVRIKGVNSAGSSDPEDQAITGIVLGTLTGLSLVSPYAGTDLTLQWNALTGASQYTVSVKPHSGASVYSATVTSTVFALTEVVMESLGGPWREITFQVVAFGNNLYSSPALYTVELADIEFAYMFTSQDAQDYSVEGNDGTINGTPSWVTGYDGTEYAWDGNDSAYITTPAELGLQYTKALWVAQSELTTLQHLITGSSDASHHMYVDTSGVLHAGHNNTDFLTYDLTSLGTASWYHLALVFDGTEMRLYVNGVQVIEVSADAVTTPTSGVRFGRASDSFLGYADNILHYKRALNVTEVEACRH